MLEWKERKPQQQQN